MEFARAHFPKAASRRLPSRVIISYVFDYVIIIFLYIVFQALDAVEPFHQHFSLDNYTLQYPYAVHERVPIAGAIAVAVLIPILIIALYTLVIDGIFSHATKSEPGHGEGRNRYTLKERLWEFNCGILGLLLSEGAAFVITGALKNATGKPRPDLIARCLPKTGSVDNPVFGLSNSSICTQTNNSILKDGFRSFPSGHSSASFAGLFYLSLYLSAKLHILDSRGEVWKTFIVLVPTLGAALIAVSRIMDARHHPFDVITGSLLGILVAWGAYRQYFPAVTEPWHKGRAYPIRSWGSTPKKIEQDYQGMSRDSSPVELSRIARKPEAMDPEIGASRSNPVVSPRNLGQRFQGDGNSVYGLDGSSSSSNFDNPHRIVQVKSF